MRHWLALAMAPRVASQKHPIPSLMDRHTISHDLQHITAHSTSPWQEPYPASSQTRPCHSFAPVARVPSARSARDGELPLCTVHALVCPLCVWRVPPLSVPPLAPSAGTPASPPLMTSDDYQMTSGTLAGSAAFRCTFAGTAATAGATEGVSVGVVGACFVTGTAVAAAWHASTHCESI